VLLALSAGCVDAVGFLTLFSIFTAHLSGDTTRLAVDLGSGEFTADALAFAVVIVTYVSGVVLGVAVVSANERRHRLLLLAEIACLVALMTIGTAARDAGELYRGGFFFYFLVALSALAMGLQTAYLRRTAGTSVQTTFITGMLTALAEDYVAWHRDRADIEARRRVAIHGSIWLGYLGGGVVGALLATGLDFEFWALVFPIALLVLVLADEEFRGTPYSSPDGRAG
jgi:uncharacterized membrane protein YoaK (UPF0700 family)